MSRLLRTGGFEHRRRCRRTQLVGSFALVFALAASAIPAAAAAPSYRFVSSPDMWNADVGDVHKASGWDTGERNSINRSWRRATETIVARLASHDPDFLLVAGDLVNGHWNEDVDGFGTFGSLSGTASKRRAIREAARIYYGSWRARVRRHGLRVHAAVGDHELGDNPWTTDEAQALIPAFRSAWTRRFTFKRGRYVYADHPRNGTQHAKTAYAFRRGPVFFVTVDVFHQRGDGSVRLKVAGAQLRWLRRVLAAANADPRVEFIVVQGHAPVLRPERRVASSGLRVEDGSSSSFWRTLRAGRVDLYLAGEFHAASSANNGGVEQVVHGSFVGFANFNYLRIDVFSTRLELKLYRASVRRVTDAELWQVGRKRPHATRVVGKFSEIGTMTITADGRELHRTGRFAEPRLEAVSLARFAARHSS